MARSEGSDSMRMWGCLLRRYRQAAGMSREQLAVHVGYSASLVASVEGGRRMPSQVFATHADKAVNARGWLAEAAQHLSRNHPASLGTDLAEEERRARILYAYDTHLLHPLLRTEAYARAVLRAHRPVLSDPEIDAQVAAERERQARMTAEPVCTYSFITEEWILYRPTGGPAAMEAQLRHLAEVADLRNVTVQVLPISEQAHAGMTGSMTLIAGPEHAWFASSGSNYQFEPDHMSALHDRYAHLRSLAFTPVDSGRLIRQVADRWAADGHPALAKPKPSP